VKFELSTNQISMGQPSDRKRGAQVMNCELQRTDDGRTGQARHAFQIFGRRGVRGATKGFEAGLPLGVAAPGGNQMDIESHPSP
jgi:hypothetical protein